MPTVQNLAVALSNENMAKCHFFFHGVYSSTGDRISYITSYFTKQNSLGDKGEVQTACCGNQGRVLVGVQTGEGLPEGSGILVFF